MANRLLNPTSLNTDLATLVLRLIFGGMFIYHGYLKLDGFSQYNSMMPDYIGIGGKATYTLVMCSEMIGGLFIALGLLTRLAIIPIFTIVNVAFFVAHKNDPFLSKMLLFVYIFLCIAIFLLGSGRYSIDQLLFRKKNQPKYS
jgi:putative oxidoreductase